MNFQKALIRWYSEHKRSLPWRKTKDPYFIWLSEIMLQQTQVKQGLPYYEKFTAHYPTVFDLAKATEAEVLKDWQGLGYYSRARNLHATAQHVAFQLNGVFPDNYSDLLKLKGIGDYTASAIASIAYNEPKAVLDGNVFRVLGRYFGVEEAINAPKGLKTFKELSQSLIYKESPGEYNQAIMEFGALQCKPKNPDCLSCPLKASCAALMNKSVDRLPIKLKKTKVLDLYFNYLVFLDPKHQTLLEQRSKKGIWQNLYQFPLVESDQSIDLKSLKYLIKGSPYPLDSSDEIFLFNEKDIVHKLSHRRLHTKFWIISSKTVLTKGISVEALRDYPVPILISNFIDEFNFRAV